MTHIDFDSICTRFISGNSIPVERARVTYDELLALKVYATRLREKLGRRVTLSKMMGRDTEHWNVELVQIDTVLTPQVKKALEPALLRKNDVAKREEILGLLQLIWQLSSFGDLLKTHLNSNYGATPSFS